MSTAVLVLVVIFVAFNAYSLRSLERSTAAALQQQRSVNQELEATLAKMGVSLGTNRLIGATGNGNIPALPQVAVTRASHRTPRAPPGQKATVIVEPPALHDVGSPRDRDGRQIIAKDEQFDTDSDSHVADEVRLTPAPPPPRPVLPTIPPGKKWGSDDANHGFESDTSLPSIGVITLNAQASAGAGIGLAAKSSWIHRMSYTNKQAYCKKWGYDLIIEDNSIIDTTRDVAWSKIPIFKKWLPKYQWLMWIDMDAFFMRFDLPIIELADNNHDLIIAKDWHGINFGVFLIRNSPWAFSLLDKMWRSPREWWQPWEEQSALMALTDPKKNPGEAIELLEHIKFPKQRDLNSYGAEFAYGNLQALYRTGDRIVHFPNCKGFQTCRSTIESFYRTMLQDNGIEDMDPNEIPGSQYPEGV